MIGTQCSGPKYFDFLVKNQLDPSRIFFLLIIGYFYLLSFRSNFLQNGALWFGKDCSSATAATATRSWLDFNQPVALIYTWWMFYLDMTQKFPLLLLIFVQYYEIRCTSLISDFFDLTYSDFWITLFSKILPYIFSLLKFDNMRFEVQFVFDIIDFWITSFSKMVFKFFPSLPKVKDIKNVFHTQLIFGHMLIVKP